MLVEELSAEAVTALLAPLHAIRWVAVPAAMTAGTVAEGLYCVVTSEHGTQTWALSSYTNGEFVIARLRPNGWALIPATQAQLAALWCVASAKGIP